MDRLIMALATGGYVGYLPKAPGTWGTLVAIPLHLVLIRLGTSNYFISLAIFFVLSIFIAGSAEKIVDRADPGIVVIDEIIGMLVALIGVGQDWLIIGVGFILFRLFDIVKPFPIRLIDQRFHGGIGIVMDDVVAGVYSLVGLRLLQWLWVP